MSKATYDIIEWDGDLKGGSEARLYDDGAIRNEKGYFLKKHPKGATITSEIASEYRARTIAKQQEYAMMGVANAMMKHSNLKYPVGTGEAWMIATEKVAEALFSDKYRDRSDALRVLADVTPSKYDKSTVIQQQQAQPAQQTNVIAVFLQQLAHKESDADIIDAE